MKTFIGLFMVAVIVACRDASPSSRAQATSSTDLTASTASTAQPGAPPTTPWPTDPCSWIPASAVESIVGPLDGAPARHDGGCRYPLKPDADVLRRREVAAKLEAASRAMAQKLGSNPEPFGADRLPSDPAVIVHVRAESEPAGEVGLRAGTRRALAWAELDSSASGEARNAAWDFSQSPIAIGLPGFLGRVGQVTVMVRPEVINIPKARLAALAAVAVDHLPDRPYAPPADVVTGKAWGRDPCGLVTAAEAEAILGTLVVPPYRIANNGVHPDPGGKACAYQTARQRVLRIEPVWSEAAGEVKLTKGIGGLAGAVLGEDPAAADTLEGPWDEAVADAASGALLFVTGDRALRIGYALSATNTAGAMAIARKGLDRLAAAR